VSTPVFVAGMVTHTDDMVRDIVSALNETSSLYANTIIIFMSDNGGPGGQQGVPTPTRFDGTVLDRNYPFPLTRSHLTRSHLTRSHLTRSHYASTARSSTGTTRSAGRSTRSTRAA